MSQKNTWVEFAREDLKIAELAFRERIYNQVCFHCQQVIEKILKAYLHNHKKNIPRTHALNEILNLCAQIDGEFADLQSICLKLDKYYIPMRYPDAISIIGEGFPEESDAREALTLAKEVMEFVIKKIDG